MNKADWEKCNKILCVRTDNIGDLLMTEPALRALKMTYPNASLTLLTLPHTAIIAPFIDCIDKTITCSPPWTKTENKQFNLETTRDLINRIKRKSFDSAIIFNTYSQNPLAAALFCKMGGIERILSYCRENPYNLISDWVKDDEPLKIIRHEVERQLYLVSQIGAKTSDKNIRVNIEKVKKEKIILIHPGCSEQKRKYPWFLYAQVAEKLSRTGNNIIFTGNKDEVGEVKQITSLIHRTRILSLAGKLNMEEFLNLINKASVLITNNTGPVHMAAALQTPVVVVYARTNPQHIPWKVKNRILFFDTDQSLQTKNSLLEYTLPKNRIPIVTPNEVIKATLELLAQ